MKNITSRLTLLSALLAGFFLLPGSLLAQGNLVSIKQVETAESSVDSLQIGSAQTADVAQVGTASSTINFDQTGDENYMRIGQGENEGDKNLSLDALQKGSGNAARAIQLGANSKMKLDQQGDGLYLAASQAGSDNSIDIAQTGMANASIVHQRGDALSAKIRQGGSFNSAYVSQSGTSSSVNVAQRD
ncbi:MAG: hypothetical protein D6719_05455 [Candidatus Dadabacteria bacterium]|nr:MAG: hypothetical protein D6719_05455 [Candidatus Dadabacteria bacterium]